MFAVSETATILGLPETHLATEPPMRSSGGLHAPAETQTCLVRIYPPGVSDSLIILRDQCTRIGRDASCQIELHDDFISRDHVHIERGGDQFVLRDCGSLNGTFVNDQRVDTQVLTPGDHIRLGNHIFKFLSTDHVEAQYHEAVYEMMTVDGLTGARNKRYFQDAFEREILRAQRHWRPIALLLIDVDHFKQVNDRFGHLAGDECLKALASRICSRIRGEDLFARFGGEEFALAMAEAPLKQSVRVAHDIVRLIETQPFSTSKGAVEMTISIGVGFANGQGPMSATDMIDQADENLYRAKRDGRNCVRF
ncbi:MAG: GGDEF domain-containing protein [Planctomycetaceae bacterium]|nr:GGDEF domain-containing protein [Planctomycetaceae bacterium]